MIQFLKSDAPYASPLQHNQRKQLPGQEMRWEAVDLRAVQRQLASNVISLSTFSQHRRASLLMSKPTTTSFQNSQNYEAYVKIMHTLLYGLEIFEKTLDSK